MRVVSFVGADERFSDADERFSCPDKAVPSTALSVPYIDSANNPVIGRVLTGYSW